MSLNLDSVNAKLARADYHAQVLKDAIKPWMDTNPYRVSRDVNADSTRYSLVAHLTGKEPELQEWSLIAGDCLHNLRSVLDHLVYAVAVHESGANPPPDERNLMFPIADTLENFNKNTWRIQNLSEPVRRVIEAVQPFNRVHPKVRPPLAILRDLENTDKHKLLQLAYAAISEGDIGFCGEQVDLTNKATIITYGGEIKEGTELLAFVFERPEPNMKFDRVNLDLVIALWHGRLDPNEPPWHDRNEVSAVLSLLSSEVREVIGLIAAVVI
jgi:hypothetical protein